MDNTKLKIDSVNKELKVALEGIRNARTPLQKQQAKTKATNLLKKKKMYEGHLNTLSNTQMTVENAHVQTQMMKDNMDIVYNFSDNILDARNERHFKCSKGINGRYEC